MPSRKKSKKSRFKKRRSIILLLALLLVVAIIAGVFYFLPKYRADSEYKYKTVHSAQLFYPGLSSKQKVSVTASPSPVGSGLNKYKIDRWEYIDPTISKAISDKIKSRAGEWWFVDDGQYVKEGDVCRKPSRGRGLYPFETKGDTTNGFVYASLKDCSEIEWEIEGSDGVVATTSTGGGTTGGGGSMVEFKYPKRPPAKVKAMVNESDFSNTQVWVDRISQTKYINKYKASYEDLVEIDLKDIKEFNPDNRWHYVVAGQYFINKSDGSCTKYKDTWLIKWDSKWSSKDGWFYDDKDCTQKISGSNGAGATTGEGATAGDDGGTADDGSTSGEAGSGDAAAGAGAGAGSKTINPDDNPNFSGVFNDPSAGETAEQEGGNIKVGICPDGSDSCDQGYNWGTYIETFFKWALRFAAVLVVLMIIYAGYIYLTSGGDSTKLNTAKERLLGAIFGYIILLLAGVITQFLGGTGP